MCDSQMQADGSPRPVDRAEVTEAVTVPRDIEVGPELPAVADGHVNTRSFDLWRDLGNVRWIHTLAAGVEFLPFDLLQRSAVVVTNSRDQLHAAAAKITATTGASATASTTATRSLTP